VTDDHHPPFDELINPLKINRQAQLDFLKEKGLYEDRWFPIEMVKLVLSLNRYTSIKVAPEAQDLIRFLTDKDSYEQSITLCRQEIKLQLGPQPNPKLFREAPVNRPLANLTPEAEPEVKFYRPPKLVLRGLSFDELINPLKINRQAQLDFLKEKDLYEERQFPAGVVGLVLSPICNISAGITPEAQDLIQFLTDKDSYEQSIALCRQEIRLQLDPKIRCKLIRKAPVNRPLANLTPKAELEVKFYRPPKLVLRGLSLRRRHHHHK
jgi:hypothetical protein